MILPLRFSQGSAVENTASPAISKFFCASAQYCESPQDGIPFLTANKLKIIAIMAMFFDHFVAVFLPHSTVLGLALRFPGRIAAPIMCYFIAEGFHYTSDRKKYILRLLIFAFISHIPFNLCFGYAFFQATSVIWGLSMGLVALTAMKDERLPILFKPIILGICCLLSVTANWNYISVLWIVSFGLLRGNFRNQIIGFCAIGILFHLIPTYLNFGFTHEGYPHWYQLGIFLTIPLLAMYNGRLGKKSPVISWAFYIFYPSHLLLIYFLKSFTQLSIIFR